MKRRTFLEKTSLSGLACTIPPFFYTSQEQEFSTEELMGKADIQLVGEGINLREEACEAFGSQCIVLAIDAKKVSTDGDENKWEIFTHGGRKPTGLDALEWVARMDQYGAGEILLTSMDRDGTRIGFDNTLTRAIAEAVPIPVIASGGVGNLDHLVDGVIAGGADAVLAASIFHFAEYTVGEAKAHMQNAGIEVRL